MFLINLSFVILICAPFSVSSREYLKEKPKFLTPCSIKSPNLETCYKGNLQNLLINWKNGVPGLPSVGKLDPLKIKKMQLEQNMLRMQMKNILVRGLSAATVTKMHVDVTNYTFITRTTVPKLHIEALYKTIGRILLLSINSNGTMWMDVENLDMSMTLKTKLYYEDNIPFVDVQSVHSKIHHIGDLRLNIENLFNGNKELERSTLDIFHENWRSIIEPILPTIQQTLDSVVLQRFKKIFNFVPLNYFLADIPKQ